MWPCVFVCLCLCAIFFFLFCPQSAHSPPSFSISLLAVFFLSSFPPTPTPFTPHSFAHTLSTPHPPQLCSHLHSSLIPRILSAKDQHTPLLFLCRLFHIHYGRPSAAVYRLDWGKLLSLKFTHSKRWMHWMQATLLALWLYLYCELTLCLFSSL